jgi:hypothetical protein
MIRHPELSVWLIVKGIDRSTSRNFSADGTNHQAGLFARPQRSAAPNAGETGSSRMLKRCCRWLERFRAWTVRWRRCFGGPKEFAQSIAWWPPRRRIPTG